MKEKRKLLSLLLAFAMFVTLIPQGAFAADDEDAVYYGVVGHTLYISKKPTKQATRYAAGVLNAKSEADVPWYGPHAGSFKSGIESVKVQGTLHAKSTACWFYTCYNLKNFDLKGLDTSKTTDMHNMFYGTALSSFKGISLRTSNVTDMSGMFAECPIESTRGLKIDTAQVTNMSKMFFNCDNLKSIDALGFDTSRVTDMSCMFKDCDSLTRIGGLEFDTKRVETMKDMFMGDHNLKTVDLSSMDTSNLENTENMFRGCLKLGTIYAGSNFTTRKIVYASEMFRDCKNILGGNGTGYDISKTGSEYAKLDNGTYGPGYLTSVADYKVVRFVDNDGELLKRQLVKVGGSAVAPENPTKGGHIFVGWDVNYSNIVEDLTVTAQYKTGKYTVRYESNGGTKFGAMSGVAWSQRNLLKGKISKNGYIFAGWYADKKFTKQVTSETTFSEIAADGQSSVTLYAKWIKGASAVKAFKAVTSTGTTVTLSWTKQSGVTGYKVYVNGKLKKTIASPKIAKTVIGKLVAGKTYRFQIAAYKVFNNKMYETSKSAVVQGVTIPAKATIAKLTSKANSITVSWGLKPCSKFEVHIATNKGFTKNLKKMTVKSGSKMSTFKKLKKGTTYYVRVRGIGKVGSFTKNGMWSAVKAIKCR